LRDGIVADGKRAADDAKRGNAGPLAQYRQQIKDLNFGDEAEKIGVDAFKDFNKEISEAIVNSENWGDVIENSAKRALKQLAAMAIQLAINKALFAAFGIGDGLGSFKIPGFANGTNYAPGGLSLVGERGPELVNLPRGAQVIPNNKIAGIGRGQEMSGNITITLSEDLNGRITGIAGPLAVQVVQQAAPAIRDAAVNATFQRGQRPGFNR
jgi:phage-related tail protein